MNKTIVIILLILFSSCYNAESIRMNEVISESTENAEDSLAVKNEDVRDSLKIDYVLLSENEKEKNKIIISKKNFMLALYYDSVKIKEYSVAVGKNPEDKVRVGDNATPLGSFYIIRIEGSSFWTHDFKDGKGEIKGAYGPYFLRLKTGTDATLSGKEWKGIGIHGTHDNSSIGTNASEGCIRMKNEELVDLMRFVETGTKVEIIE
jgi:lipoprotein-anchoring transpeptidase ErfK/SrfK